MPEYPAVKGKKVDGIGAVVHRTLAVAGILVLLLFLWKIRDALLFAFAGVLLAVFVRGLANIVHRHTPLSTRWSVILVGVVLVGALVGLGWLLGPRLASQFNELTQRLPTSYDALRDMLGQSQWGSFLVSYLPESGAGLSGGVSMSRLSGMASTALDVMTTFVLVLFIGIFLIADPGLYRRGLLHLVPKRRRERAGEVLDALGEGLWHWLVGRWVASLFVFLAATVGLWLLGVPLALALGLIAGLLDFVPFVGPIIAAIPAILLAFTVSPTTALYTMLLYLGLQQIEGNIVTPIIQQKAVSLPPAMVLIGLTAFGLLFGLLGILLATPLLVVAMILVKMLYVEDALGDEVDVAGEN